MASTSRMCAGKNWCLPFALLAPRTSPANNVDKLDGSRNDLRGTGDAGQISSAARPAPDAPDVRIDGTERDELAAVPCIVDSSALKSVDLPTVRKTDNAAFETHELPRMRVPCVHHMLKIRPAYR